MNLIELVYTRLSNQCISDTPFNVVKETVNWMGALQAQDFAMIKWAVGVRLKNATEHLVDDAINNGDILRVHLLRPTWYLVSVKNYFHNALSGFK